jgi:OmpA-OmpF porin, OOP family
MDLLGIRGSSPTEDYSMRLLFWCAALLVSLWCLPAAAVNTEDYAVPYFGISAGTLMTDSVRDSDNGQGVHLVFGVPFNDPKKAVELRLIDYGFRRADGKKDYQSGLFIDYVQDFGGFGRGFFRSFKPFVIAGAGFIQEDVVAEKHLHFGVNAGGGMIIPLPIAGWSVRLDGRAQWQLNNKSYPNFLNSSSASSLLDYQIAVGLQLPLTWFFDRPIPVDPVEEDCPLAVVDPVTGRRDCAVDSDRDGVPDHLDRCPGTPPGTPVDRWGCPRAPVVSNDADGDGVPDSRDQCPGTPAGFRVDASGCIVVQTVHAVAVTFESNSARLTSQARQYLDGVSDALAAQKELSVEIAGHTDNVGSQAYNLLLSQQRAEAVRQHLVERGVDEVRLVAIGYGQEEPVASNATEEGRTANRRVEFRIRVSD